MVVKADICRIVASLRRGVRSVGSSGLKPRRSGGNCEPGRRRNEPRGTARGWGRRAMLRLPESRSDSTKFDSSKLRGSPEACRTAARQWVLARNSQHSSPSRIRALGPDGVRGVESRGGKSMEPLEHWSLDHRRTIHRSCSRRAWARSASCSGFRRSAARRIAGTCATIAALAAPSGR